MMSKAIGVGVGVGVGVVDLCSFVLLKLYALGKYFFVSPKSRV
jgi:hypothetical protein